MALDTTSSDDAAGFTEPADVAADKLQPRGFQYEMLEESLKRNTIVATRLLIGADGVEHWRDQRIWDEILRGINIVVSTHQVLLDALIHGFVQMARLSLMIFDEAHHCIADHPASRILRDFYHPHLAASSDHIPAILGLTASPVVNSKVGKLEELESNLQAVSRTPKLNREELLRYVHKPALVKIVYPSGSLDIRRSQLVMDLYKLKNGLDIEQDPYVKKMMSDPACDSRDLQKVKLNRKTYCQEQLKNLSTRAETIWLELGPWAADWYINACIRKFQRAVTGNPTDFSFLGETEKIYLEQCLSSLLSGISEAESHSIDDVSLSRKVSHLIGFLVIQQTSDFTGLVFVRTRAEVAVLAQLLSMHPKTKPSYNVGTFVGVSASTSRKANIGELVDVRGQIDTLDDLRAGRKNLVITTSALEEGIDVTACNTVICFDKPSNLKSVIQRRGRARKSESTFAIMWAEDDDSSMIATWEQLEEKMQKQYMDDMRQLQKLETLETIDEGYREFVVEETGAKLLLADAVSHLYHFCATLTTGPSSNRAPTFMFHSENEEMFTAKVVLPISVDASVRSACSRSAWTTEKAAKRDAAFEAYIQLYHARLISDNLLPIQAYDEAIAEIESDVDKVPSLVQVAGQLNPWHLVATQWQAMEDFAGLHCFNVSLCRDDDVVASMQMLLPCPLPATPDIVLYWDARTTFRATICPFPWTATRSIHPDIASPSTTLLLHSVFHNRMDVKQTDFVALFIPSEGEDVMQWAKRFVGTIKGDKLKQIDVSTLSLDKIGIVRDLSQDGLPHILKGFQEGSSALKDDTSATQSMEECGPEILLKASRFPKRTDFLHKVSEQNQKPANMDHTTLLKPGDCEIDRLPLIYAQLAAFVPSILHRVGVRLTAAHLCSSVLANIAFVDLELVVTSITASSAQAPTNYQRQEFLGDSILKFLTSLTLMSEHLRWPEGLLSRAKDHIVSNASLAKAALAVGLDSYILTESFTGAKWRPLYVSDQMNSPTGQPRQLSTKTLADVVEALVGAASLDGGFAKAVATLQTFLPKVSWSAVEDRNEILHSAYRDADESITFPPHFSQLEQLVDYTFTLKSLPLEALTHSSYPASNATISYERLEFLGDICLDIIVACTSFRHDPPITTHNLHLLRTAVVNADFLAFLCLTLSMSVPRTNITTGNRKNDVSMSETSVPIYIWSFMRHASSTVRQAQQDVLERYEALKAPILECLRQGTHIPWALLARLDAPKFFSDVIEAVIGAIYVDSHGSLPACEAFLERLGVMG
ncbi:MAG: hypothetical protein L6R39_003331, partial [Caloplaca ligustica]